MLVVVVDITADVMLGFGGALVRPQIDLLVLDRAPEAFDEDVIAPRIFAVDADRDAEERPHESLEWQTPSERRGERLTGYRSLPVAA